MLFRTITQSIALAFQSLYSNGICKMVLNASANRITYVRLALNFNEKLMILVDLTNSTAERNAL